MSVAENQRGEVITSSMAPALGRGGGKPGQGYAAVLERRRIDAVSVALRGREGGGTAELGGPVANALRASTGGGDKEHVLAFHHTQDPISGDVSPCLSRKVDGMGLAHAARVRRLTPLECERLQGFPDNWTRVPIARVSRNRLKALRAWEYREIDGEVWKLAADGPRYRAIGNSMAVPVMAWIGRRLAFVHHLLLRRAA